jgi:hypothetical protein
VQEWPKTQASQEARDAGAFIAQVSKLRFGPRASDPLRTAKRELMVDARYLTVALPSPAWIAVVNGVSPQSACSQSEINPAANCTIVSSIDRVT